MSKGNYENFIEKTFEIDKFLGEPKSCFIKKERGLCSIEKLDDFFKTM